MPSEDVDRGDSVPLPRFFLKRGDQLTAAVLTAIALLAMAIYWWHQGGLQGRLVEVEQLPLRKAEFLVDVNTAAWPELAQVPEIGETLAKRIVEFRKSHGSFQNLETLLDVPGIGPRTLERMRPFLQPPAVDTASERPPAP